MGDVVTLNTCAFMPSTLTEQGFKSVCTGGKLMRLDGINRYVFFLAIRGVDGIGVYTDVNLNGDHWLKLQFVIDQRMAFLSYFYDVARGFFGYGNRHITRVNYKTNV